jgi:hypothetical protein
MATRDEIATRLKRAAWDGGQVICGMTAEYTTSRWEAKQALDALADEIAAILAEQGTRIAALESARPPDPSFAGLQELARMRDGVYRRAVPRP